MPTSSSQSITILDRILSGHDKGWLRQKLIGLARRMAQQSWAIPLIAGYVGTQLRTMTPGKTSPTRLRLLVLNEERYRADLDELGRHPEVELISLPSTLQQMVNAIWLSRIRGLIENDPNDYLRNDIPEIREARAKLGKYLAELIRILARCHRIDAIVSCTFYYRQDREWEAGGEAVGIPFIALHKENMKDPVTHDLSVERYRTRKIVFSGSRIFLFNRLEKDVILRAGVCDESRISVVGGLRMDRIHRQVREKKVPEPRRQVVLFSSHHCIGLLSLPGSNAFFSDNSEHGFVEYFDLVHGTMARLAAENPDIDVWIKPKWMPIWSDRIRDAIRRTGFDPDTLSNLHISVQKSAQELIEESAVVVGINSTTLLEAKLFGRPVVVPLFAEAAGKYYDKHVYFHKYMEAAFTVARTPEEMFDKILIEVEGRGPERTIPQGMVEDYLGIYDGQVADRVIAQIREDVQTAKPLRG